MWFSDYIFDEIIIFKMFKIYRPCLAKNDPQHKMYKANEFGNITSLLNEKTNIEILMSETVNKSDISKALDYDWQAALANQKTAHALSPLQTNGIFCSMSQMKAYNLRNNYNLTLNICFTVKLAYTRAIRL